MHVLPFAAMKNRGISKVKIEELKELAALMRDYELTRLEMNPEGSIVMERKATEVVSVAEKPVVAAPMQTEKKEALPQGRIIKAPMVGVFYAAASPEAQPFVKVGDVIKKGDVVCIIEAMKLMNEISADIEGEVAEILVQNGQLVEYGEPLFRIK